MIVLPISNKDKLPKNSYAIRNDGINFYVFESEEDYTNNHPKSEIKSREVAAWKVRAILKTMGLIPAIEAALNSLPDDVRDIALAAWEYSATINQYSPTVKLIQHSCSLTDEQVQQIFDNAEKINI